MEKKPTNVWDFCNVAVVCLFYWLVVTPNTASSWDFTEMRDAAYTFGGGGFTVWMLKTLLNRK